MPKMKENNQPKETRFKTVIYFNLRRDNSHFTLQEIRDKKHVKRMGSFDRYKGKGGTWINDEQSAFNKMVHMLERSMVNRYKTAFIVINNYKGYTIVLRKYIDGVLRFNMGVKFWESDEKTGNNKVYNIRPANDLIERFKNGTLTEAQSKLIKKVDASIPTAQPYITKIKKTG